MKIKIEMTEPAFGFNVGIQTLIVHDADECSGEYCCIHNPSPHHMLEWKQLWRADRHMMERICPHGVGHPDPDDLNMETTHGCDLCCVVGENQ